VGVSNDVVVVRGHGLGRRNLWRGRRRRDEGISGQRLERVEERLDPRVTAGFRVPRILERMTVDVGANQIRQQTESEEVLVAERDGRVIGALVRDGDHVEAIAIHPDRRGTGVGRTSIEAALDEIDRLTPALREAVRPFDESRGFEIEAREKRFQ
jgi:GNAT superfamily N-acetyltransferase